MPYKYMDYELESVYEDVTEQMCDRCPELRCKGTPDAECGIGCCVGDKGCFMRVECEELKERLLELEKFIRDEALSEDYLDVAV